MEPTLLTSMRRRVLLATMTRSGFPSHLAVTYTRAAASAVRTESPLWEGAGPSKTTSVSAPTSEANNTKDSGRNVTSSLLLVRYG